MFYKNDLSKVFCFCLGFLIISSCHKDSPVPTYYLPQEFKDWIYFQPGTYWIYEDSATGGLDSSFVSLSEMSISAGYVKRGEDVDRYAEGFVYQVRSNAGFIFEYRGGITCWSPEPGLSCYTVYKENTLSSEGPTTVLLKYEPVVKTISYPDTRITDIFETVEINGVNWENVVRTESDKDYSEYWYRSVYYTAKGIGIVRKEIEETTGIWKTWNLIRYHIQQ